MITLYGFGRVHPPVIEGCMHMLRCLEACLEYGINPRKGCF